MGTIVTTLVPLCIRCNSNNPVGTRKIDCDNMEVVCVSFGILAEDRGGKKNGGEMDERINRREDREGGRGWSDQDGMTRDGRDGRRKLRGENCARLMARFQSIVYIVTQGGRGYGGGACFDKYLRLWFIKSTVSTFLGLLPRFFFFFFFVRLELIGNPPYCGIFKLH